MGHEYEDLLGAYVLGALSLEEHQRVESHLKSCKRCQDNVASYQLVVEGLLHAANPKRPPKSLRNQLHRQIGQPIETPRWRRAVQRVPATAFGLALGLIILASINIGILLQAQRLLDRGQDAAAQQRAGQTAMAIASYPSSQVASIEEDGLRGTFVYDPDLPLGVMYVWGLQPPSEDQAYQAWLVDAQGQRLSGGLLTFSEDPGFGWLLIEAPTPMSEFISLGVTLEPAGGSPAPTGPRILGTDL